jgi:hypothetical protein
MTRLPALVVLALALGACALPPAPAATPLAGEARAKRIERLSFQDAPEPNLYRIEFDAARSQDIRARAALESPGDRSDPYHAFIQFLEVVAEQELRSRSLCAGTVKLVSAIDGVDGTGPMTAVFACRPSIF